MTVQQIVVDDATTFGRAYAYVGGTFDVVNRTTNETIARSFAKFELTYELDSAAGEITIGPPLEVRRPLFFFGDCFGVD